MGVDTYRVGEELHPRTLFLSLAEHYGLRPQVAGLFDDVGDLHPDAPDEPLGTLLLRTREAQNMTLKDVHARCGISRSQLSFYETGIQKNPGIRTIQAIAYGYRLPFALVLVSILNEIYPRKQPRQRRRTDNGTR